MICKWCGEKIARTDRKCKSCGAELPPLSENGGFKCTLIIGKSKETNEASASDAPHKESAVDKNALCVKKTSKNINMIAVLVFATILLVQTIVFSVGLSKINSYFKKVSFFAKTEEIELYFNLDDLEKGKVNGIATCNETPLWNEIEYTCEKNVTDIVFAVDTLDAKGRISIKIEAKTISVEEGKFSLDEFGKQQSFKVEWEYLDGEKWKDADEGEVYKSDKKQTVRCVVTRESTDGGIVKIIINGLQIKGQ